MNYLQAVAFGVLLAWLMALCAVLGWGTAMLITRPGERRRRDIAYMDARNAAEAAMLAEAE